VDAVRRRSWDEGEEEVVGGALGSEGAAEEELGKR